MQIQYDVVVVVLHEASESTTARHEFNTCVKALA